MTDDPEDQLGPEGSERTSDSTAQAGLTEEEITGRKKRRLEEKQYVTGRIGESCRYLGFGLLALFYAISISGEDFPKQLWAEYNVLLRAAGALGAITVLADYVQYLAGDFSARRALARKNDSKNDFMYDKTWLSYRIRNWMYWTKQASALMGGVIIAVIMISALAFPLQTP